MFSEALYKVAVRAVRGLPLGVLGMRALFPCILRRSLCGQPVEQKVSEQPIDCGDNKAYRKDSR